MDPNNEIVNRVANSGIITLNFDEILTEIQTAQFDLEPFLWQGLALKEKDFREAIKNYDWSKFQNQHVAVFCTADAIIQTWAFMLIASKLQEQNATAYFCQPVDLPEFLALNYIQNLNAETFANARVVVKGCGTFNLSPNCYVALTQKLQPIVKTLLFGEPCSTVPVYKQPK